MMDAKEFRSAARGAARGAAAQTAAAGAGPPGGLSPALQALWHLAQGEWDAAHGCAQDDHTRDGSWVHAHLHRVEGDLANAGYWYRRAERPPCETPLDDEWEEIAGALLAAAAAAAGARAAAGAGAAGQRDG